MAIGRRQTQQSEMFIPAAQIARGPGHPFYTKLNEVLAEAGFDTAYSDGFRTRFRRETGQWSDASRTPFRLKSDSVPADIGQF